MDDEDDRRLLDIIGDVQALNDYLYGSSSKSINEGDVANAAFGSANSFYTSSTGDSSSALKDGTNHMGAAGGAGLPLPGSLQFIEGDLSGTSPSRGELGEEQPFDILQKSLQEADITEQTLAQEALLESPPPTAPFPQQLVSGGFGGMPVLQAPASGPFPGVPPQGFIQQAAAQPLQNGSAGHIQILGSFNGPPSMMTINSLEPPQILLRPGGSASPGLGGGVLVQRQAAQAGAAQGAVFNPATGGQVSMPFKGCGTPVPLQNIIIQRGPSPQMLVKPIQPKPLQLGGQTVYNISGLGQQPLNAPPTSSPYTTGSSTQAPQQMTVNIVNQPSLPKPTSGPQVVNHSGSIMIHSPLGQQQQQQGSLPPGQYLLPSSLALTPGTTTQALQALNGQVLHTQLQGTGDPASTNTAYSGTFLTNQSAAVQLVSGQNFATSGQLIVNQAVVSGQLGQASPALVQVSQAMGARPKNQPGFTSSTPLAPTPVQSGYTLVNSSDGGLVAGYTPQPQGGQSGGVLGLQGQQQVSVNLGHHFLVPLAQDGAHTGTQGTSEPQFETQSYLQTQVSHSLSPAPKQPQLQTQAQLVNLLGSKAGKPSIGLETVVCLPNQVGSPQVPNAQMTQLKRPAPQQLTKGGLVLQQLKQDQAGVLSGSRSPFSSPDDTVRRLLPYHVFQGPLPSDDDFQRVDEEFEAVATQVLKRTEAMLNKYRRLLLVDAERTSPSSEMVMIDRTFNQEERSNLTQDRRLALVDPDGFLEDFCCLPKPMDTALTREVQGEQGAPIQLSPASRDPHGRDSACVGRGWEGSVMGGADPSLRTEPQPGSKDPGGEQPEVSLNEHLETAIKSILQLKRTQGRSLSANPNPALLPPPPSSAPRNPPAPGQGPAKPAPSDYSQPLLADTDSVLEAAVNSILEC
ncbi:BRD4-interacting chromatin-remodeling complex-associated protein-like [Anguilla anguilla]|uniref:BRD4-interacting chromatin-remodeling complex-associated protein-like n=1 Tax=Anguilla anguilla TaxID=7936 RepID=UPI0015AB7268|nr:BRD4-interacting chromatin-remodeling complex-associated protein-like [Anguilla anguilla]XP_035256532.1 BRD4-interacting chromatin-remodeling complex-associated protein-like [Anguilla anguilla]